VKRLLEGYQRFRVHRWHEQKSLYRELDKGQTPHACILSCCDSRVDPAAIFDAEPGELFVIRNVANLVPPYKPGEGLQGTSTAIEYAVRVLKVETLLILGHERCGGIAAAIQPMPGETAFIDRWIHLLDAAKEKAGNSTDAMELEGIKVSLDRLMTFPFVAEAVGAGTLKLEGARFSIFNGRLEILNRKTGAFAIA
jgi:carbonic anhydrase